MSDNLRELDVACARAMGHLPDPARCGVCGWPLGDGVCMPGNCAERPVPSRRYDAPALYSSDPAAVRLLEDEIARRGLRREYTTALLHEIDNTPEMPFEYGWRVVWGALRATPEQRVRAFLAVMEGK